MKKYRKSLILLTMMIPLIVLIINSCSSPSEPAYVPEPGRRDYEWTIDTIKVPLLVIARIWGTASDDIWLTGFGGSSDSTLWHFNGKKWTAIREITGVGHGIYGTSKNNVWVEQRSNNNELQIWRYNGTNWEKNQKLSFPGHIVPFINEIWGEKENEMYLVGSTNGNSNGECKAFLYRYNGVYWQELLRTSAVGGFYKVRKIGEELILFGISVNNGLFTGKVFKFSRNELIEIHSGTASIDIQKIDSRLYIFTDRREHEYKYGRMFYIKDVPAGYYWNFLGRSEKDLFYLTDHRIDHYNGTDIVTIKEIEGDKIELTYCYVLPDGIALTYLDNKTGNNLIVRGKLKEKEAK